MNEPRQLPLPEVLDDALWPDGRCIRHDVVANYMAVKQYAEKGTLPALYEKIARLRCGTIDEQTEYTPERIISIIRGFQERINRSDLGDFNRERPIMLGQDGQLAEGAHRLACCMYFGIDPWVTNSAAKASHEDFGWYKRHLTSDELVAFKRATEEVYDRFVWTALSEEIGALEYPPNHDYDPETLAPNGATQERLHCLQKYAPELWLGGDTLLDVGSSKGLISLKLAKRYRRVWGWEPIERAAKFADRVRGAHGIQNVSFLHGTLADIPDDDRSEVVYAGHLNHHLFDREVRDRTNPPFWFMRRLAGLAKDVLVVDGPFTFDDVTLADVADKGEWSQDQRAMFTVEGHAAAIADEFTLRRVGPSGTGPRQIAVFVRRD